MANAQKNINDVTVGEVMQRDVLAVDADWPLDKLARFLVDNSISGAPVTDENGELVGVVSMTDLVRHNSITEKDTVASQTHDVYLYELERHIGNEELQVFHTQYESPVQVREIMTPMIFKVSEEDSIREVADIMLKGRIHRVFVTRDTLLTGIVTALDMMQVIRNL
ncbi:MAG: CBS domain-containing protein [Gammaproteobacteria bacterium]|jgi:CBS domain-containing protein|nr:CBS domain-containing protein [Gammaproteobacteria bacterium]